MDIDTSAAMLYGLIHARFIITTNGLQSMVRTTFLSTVPVLPLTVAFHLVQIF